MSGPRQKPVAWIAAGASPDRSAIPNGFSLSKSQRRPSVQQARRSLCNRAGDAQGSAREILTSSGVSRCRRATFAADRRMSRGDGLSRSSYGRSAQPGRGLCRSPPRSKRLTEHNYRSAGAVCQPIDPMFGAPHLRRSGAPLAESLRAADDLAFHRMNTRPTAFRSQRPSGSPVAAMFLSASTSATVDPESGGKVSWARR